MAPYLARKPAPSRRCAPVLAALAMCLPGSAVAAEHAGDGARLAAPCAGCHGTAGRPPADSVMPGLAGRDASELSGMLKAYRSGERASEEMGRIARGYSDAEIAALSAWFAARSPRSDP